MRQTPHVGSKSTVRGSATARGTILCAAGLGSAAALSGVLLAASFGSPRVPSAGATTLRPAAIRAESVRPSAVARSAHGGGSVHASAGGKDASIKLTATPGAPKAGEVVRFTLSAHIAHATGALVRSLAYGDGSSAPPVAVPQYCLAFPGRAASETWRFSHSYAKPGHYDVTASAGSNCGGGHATVRLAIVVH